MVRGFLNDRYCNLEYILGNKEIPEPGIIEFRNTDEAYKILSKHINSTEGTIFVHGDVDFDGIASAFEVVQFIRELNPEKKIKPCINKEKEHGISEQAVRYFNKLNDGANSLVIVVDSSCNCTEYIKSIRHDVLVIDHHELKVSEEYLTGATSDGVYTVITNMIGSDNFKADKRFSAGLVIYEFLRYYQKRDGLADILQQKKMYQWAACTLFTDVIDTDCLRNIYYVNKSFTDSSYETNLDTILNILDYHRVLTKTFINYRLAPVINRAIRAGKSALALDIILNHPGRIADLNVYKQLQDEYLNMMLQNVQDRSGYVAIDIGDIPKSYAGLAANKALDSYKKSAIAYKVIDNIAVGSFRGLHNGLDYRRLIENLGLFAEGHDKAFGIKIPLEHIQYVMGQINEKEAVLENCEYITGGHVKVKGKYHINNINDFKANGFLWQIGAINSRIAGGYGDLNIVFSLEDTVLVEEFPKYYKYTCAGLNCKAFEKIQSPEVVLYIEYGTELSFYLRNKWY